jgi:anti-sigma B factor antagonist
MYIQNEQINGITVLTIRGSIDSLTAPQVSEYIDGLITKGVIKLVADFDGVDYTSSAGLRVLLGAIKQTRAQGGDLCLAAVQPDVKKVLDLSGFTSIFKLFGSVDSALAGFYQAMSS